MWHTSIFSLPVWCSFIFFTKTKCQVALIKRLSIDRIFSVIQALTWNAFFFWKYHQEDTNMIVIKLCLRHIKFMKGRALSCYYAMYHFSNGNGGSLEMACYCHSWWVGELLYLFWILFYIEVSRGGELGTPRILLTSIPAASMPSGWWEL